MNMQNTSFETSAPVLTDDQIEAQVFRDLEAMRTATRNKLDKDAIVFQYPDNRTVIQRLRAWWYLRQQHPAPTVTKTEITPKVEPEWPGHWATTKYL